MKNAALGNKGRASSAHEIFSVKVPARLTAPAKLYDFSKDGEETSVLSWW